MEIKKYFCCDLSPIMGHLPPAHPSSSSLVQFAERAEKTVRKSAYCASITPRMASSATKWRSKLKCLINFMEMHL